METEDVRKCGVPSIFWRTADMALRGGTDRSEHAGLPPPGRVLVLDGRGQTVGYAFVMPKLRRVLRTVLPGAVEDSQVSCLILSGQGNAVVTG